MSTPQENRLDDVWSAARELASAENYRAGAHRARDAALRHARHAGCTFPAIAAAAGLNPRRVAQIVSGR